MAPRDGRTKPGEAEDNIDGALTAFCNCNYTSRKKENQNFMTQELVASNRDGKKWVNKHTF